jgi:hypothetical protein
MCVCACALGVKYMVCVRALSLCKIHGVCACALSLSKYCVCALSLSSLPLSKYCVCSLSLFLLFLLFLLSPSLNIVCVCSLSSLSPLSKYVRALSLPSLPSRNTCALSLFPLSPLEICARCGSKGRGPAPQAQRSYHGCCYHGRISGAAARKGRVRLRRPCHEEHEEKHTEIANEMRMLLMVYPPVTLGSVSEREWSVARGMSVVRFS